MSHRGNLVPREAAPVATLDFWWMPERIFLYFFVLPSRLWLAAPSREDAHLVEFLRTPGELVGGNERQIPLRTYRVPLYRVLPAQYHLYVQYAATLNSLSRCAPCTPD